MSRQQSITVIPAVIAAVTMLALLIVPTTRWRVVEQIDWSLGGRAPLVSKDVVAQEMRAHSDDVRVQIADATAEKDGRVPRLRALLARFPDSPSLYACILSQAAHDEIDLDRDETYLYNGSQPPDDTRRYRKVASPSALAAFDRDAAAGEKRDPDNAYFPLVRAIGLFAGHRDVAALAMPALMALVLVARSRTRRIPASVGIVIGFSKAAWTTACVAVLVYGALIAATMAQEIRINRDLEAMVRHEGRFCAARIGKRWPGQTEWPSEPNKPAIVSVNGPS
jgi:hypothetical protein